MSEGVMMAELTAASQKPSFSLWLRIRICSALVISMWGTQLIDSPMPFISTATGERLMSYQEPCIVIRGQEWDSVLVYIS